jgi:riboflavin-specific deaminase-like protein
LSYAQGLDGSIALDCAEPLALSGPESLALTHQLRSIHDGILVGIGTVISDNPQLNVRHWAGQSPQPIVLDSSLRIPQSARLCQLPDRKCWVLTTHEGENALLARGDDVLKGLEITALHDSDDGRVCLQCALKVLRRKGITSLMVEGGAHVITAFLKARLADALVLTVAPRLVGGYKAVGDLGVAEKSFLPKISPMFTEKLGDDLVVWGSLQYGPAHRCPQQIDARRSNTWSELSDLLL